MSAKSIIYLSYQGGKLVLTDDEGNGPSSSCDFTTNVESNGKVGWQLKDNTISSIDNIQVIAGADIFKKLPSGNATAWEGKIDKKTTGEATYNIIYSVGGVQQPPFDPRLIIKAPTS